MALLTGLFPKCVYCHQYLTSLQIFVQSPKMEKYCSKILSSINYASDSVLHKRSTCRQMEIQKKKKELMKIYINLKYVATYKLFLQHSFKVTMSPFHQTLLKHNWKHLNWTKNLLILLFQNTVDCRMVQLYLFKYIYIYSS